MPMYRIVDLNIQYTPQSEYAAAFLAEYQTEAVESDLSVYLSPSTIAAEATLPVPVHNGVCEVTALQRELHRQFPAHKRLFLHAAGVVYRGKAYAFIAPSGTGKTTHVWLWKQFLGESVRILNGDKLVVRIGENEVTAYGNPWKGKERLGENTVCPLDGLFVLTRSDYACCFPLSATEALPHLLRATGYPKALDERLTVLSLLEQLSQTTALYHVCAPKTTDAVQAVLSQIGGYYED